MKQISQESEDYSDSSSACFEIRQNGKHMPPLPLFTRKLDEDDDISGTRAMLMRRKQLKKTKTTLVSSSSVFLKMNWTKDDELTILTGIVKYENEKKWSYASEWNDFYDYMRDSMDSDFSKKQLMNKIKKLKKRFKENQARSNDGKGFYFTNTDDEQVFSLSLTIWGEKEIASASNESFDQTKWLALKEDVPCEEHKQVSNKRMKIDKQVTNTRMKIEKEKIVDDLSVLKENVPCAEHKQVSNTRMKIDNGEKEVSNTRMKIDNGEKQVSNTRMKIDNGEKQVSNTRMKIDNGEKQQVSNTRMKIDNGEKEKIVDDLKEDEDERLIRSAKMEIDNVEKEKREEDLSILQEALVGAASFQKLGENLQKSLLGNLKNIGTKERKELTDEWKALLAEDMQLNIKKQSFSAKLVNAGFSA